MRNPENRENAVGGTLYLVPTPIGNMGDITLRALDILSTVDIIAAEDTRHTGLLLKYWDIKKPLICNFEHNEKVSGNKIIEALKEGKSVALVSDAGCPGISDPGAVAAKEAIAQNIAVSVLPGASAGITALLGSGLISDGYCFGGFIPRDSADKKRWLLDYGKFKRPVIIYESPKRLVATLKSLKENWGNRKACVARELTKKFEEYIRGNIEDIILELEKREAIKGEIVLIVDGYDETTDVETSDFDLITEAKKLLAEGFSKKDVARNLSKITNLSRNEIYSKLLDLDQ